MQGFGAFVALVILIGLFGPCRGCTDGPNRHGSVAPRRSISPSLNAPAPQTAARTQYDPVNHPEDVIAIIDDVSARTGTPTGIIYGLWRSESSEVYGDRGGAGGANVLEQYRIRDRWHPGNGSSNAAALRQIARNAGWNAETVQGSRGKSTMDVNNRDFGGCIGPMQITPTEWLDDPVIADKDPLVLYWAMYGAGRRLKKDHDGWVASGKSDQDAWSIAIRDYAGNRDALPAWGYYANKIVPRWREWSGWKKDGTLVQHITAVADYSARKWRDSMYASR